MMNECYDMMMKFRDVRFYGRRGSQPWWGRDGGEGVRIDRGVLSEILEPFFVREKLCVAGSV